MLVPSPFLMSAATADMRLAHFDQCCEQLREYVDSGVRLKSSDAEAFIPHPRTRQTWRRGPLSRAGRRTEVPDQVVPSSPRFVRPRRVARELHPSPRSRQGRPGGRDGDERNPSPEMERRGPTRGGQADESVLGQAEGKPKTVIRHVNRNALSNVSGGEEKAQRQGHSDA